MSKSFEKKPERPWPNPYLEVAAIVGHTTPTTSRIWFRTGKTGRYRIVIFLATPVNQDIVNILRQTAVSLTDLPAPVEISHLAPGKVAMLSFEVTDNTDTTHVVELTNLHPLKCYRYVLWSDDENRPVIGHQREHSFRTLPDTLVPSSFGFFSCHMPYKTNLFGRTKLVNEDMWDYLKDMLVRHTRKELRFTIAGGDQVYSDGVETLDIWKYLNKVMGHQGNKLMPLKETMVTWYRDIYRGYWGISAVREVFSNCPMYMMWDDHEIGDGWGSYRFSPDKPKRDELNKLLPELEDKGLSHADGMKLIKRMFAAATQVYNEYQHSHNPDMTAVTPAFPVDSYDYHFSFPAGAIYMLDGRGHRDFNRNSNKILGAEQHKRFAGWLDSLDPVQTPFVFVVSAVPMVHLSHLVVDQGEGIIAKTANLTDDLRDSWEHKAHTVENRKLLKALFNAAKKGHKVCILSGDVHVSAVFRLTDPASNKNIYQLTSSAITYNLPRPMGWGLGLAVPDDGVTRDGYQFKRLARYTGSNFSLVRVDPEKGSVDFQLYGEQVNKNPNDSSAEPNSHSIVKVELTFS